MGRHRDESSSGPLVTELVPRVVRTHPAFVLLAVSQLLHIVGVACLFRELKKYCSAG